MSIGIQASMNKFAFLHVQDSSEDGDGAAEEQQAAGNRKLSSKPKLGSIGNASNNAKKRPRRRRRKNKSTSSDPPAESDETQMKEWVERDQSLVDKLYNEDLRRAIELSKVDSEKIESDKTHLRTMTVERPHLNGAQGNCVSVKSDSTQKKEKKKNKSVKTISLEAFLHRVESSMQLQNDTSSPLQEERRTQAKADPEKTNFFDQVEKEALYMKRNEHMFQRLPVKTEKKHENHERLERSHKDDEKDQVIEKLRNEIGDWEIQFKHVKKRNQQLLVMLQQGEMKDKSELLMEIDHLSVLRDELTQEVSNLNESLEQERSRSRKLKDELTKLQTKKSQDSDASK